ncbi:hypothetical protein DYY66_1878 [Candidatus Nitrosotalea sp. FS]|nr:hypothetical protein [Candidatus Nitrosotalea sp. FS]
MGRQMKTKITKRKTWSGDDNIILCNKFQINLSNGDTMNGNRVK